MAKIKESLTANRIWSSSVGTYIAGQAAIDGADATAITMEQKWGAGRLRLLVSPALREKFDRQRFLTNAAIWHGDLAEVQLQSARMVTAWMALDRAAEAAGALELSPVVWEVALEDGVVVALVRTSEEAHVVVAEGRKVVVYTLDELARILSNYQAATQVKLAIPGATVEAIRRDISDPLNGIRDAVSLDDELDDLVPHLGA